MGARTTAREAALQMLFAVEANGADVERASRSFGVSSRGRRGSSLRGRVVRGVTRGRAHRRAHRQGEHDWRLERMARVDRNVLRVGAWELGQRPDVPRAVDLDEAVEIAKRYGTEESGAFVNGVLNRIADDSDGTTRIAVPGAATTTASRSRSTVPHTHGTALHAAEPPKARSRRDGSARLRDSQRASARRRASRVSSTTAWSGAYRGLSRADSPPARSAKRCSCRATKLPFDKVVLFGVGRTRDFSELVYRAVIEKVLGTLEGLKARTAVVELPGRHFGGIAPERAADILLERAGERPRTTPGRSSSRSKPSRRSRSRRSRTPAFAPALIFSAARVREVALRRRRSAAARFFFVGAASTPPLPARTARPRRRPRYPRREHRRPAPGGRALGSFTTRIPPRMNFWFRSEVVLEDHSRIVVESTVFCGFGPGDFSMRYGVPCIPNRSGGMPSRRSVGSYCEKSEHQVFARQLRPAGRPARWTNIERVMPPTRLKSMPRFA